MARDTPDESVPLELIVPGNTKRGSLISSRFVDLTADGLSNGHSNNSVQKPLKLKNFISKGEVFDSLHLNSTKVITFPMRCPVFRIEKRKERSSNYVFQY